MVTFTVCDYGIIYLKRVWNNAVCPLKYPNYIVSLTFIAGTIANVCWKEKMKLEKIKILFNIDIFALETNTKTINDLNSDFLWHFIKSFLIWNSFTFVLNNLF